MRFRIVVFALVALGVSAAPVRSDDQVLTPLPNVSAIGAYGGHVVWSQLNSATGRWSLMDLHAGVVNAVPVSSRSVPFDVDLGPDRQGQPVAVYSRCRKDPAAALPNPDWMTAEGCDIYTVRLGGAKEHRVASVSSLRGSETTPSLWRGSLAFARRLPGHRAARLLVHRAGSTHLRRLRGGTVPHCLHPGCPNREPRPYAGVDALDLGPSSLAMLWRLTNGNVVGVDAAWELRSNSLRGGRTALIASGYSSGTCGFQVPLSPSAAGQHVVFLEMRAPCAINATPVVSIDWRSGTRREAEPSSGFIYAIARDGKDIYSIRGPRPAPANAPGVDACRSAPNACALVRSTGLPFRPVPSRKVAPPVF